MISSWNIKVVVEEGGGCGGSYLTDKGNHFSPSAATVLESRDLELVFGSCGLGGASVPNWPRLPDDVTLTTD